MKKKSPAYLKAEAKRDAKHKGACRIVSKDLSCVVYYWTTENGRPAAAAYTNRALKPCIYNWFSSEKERKERINKFIARCMANKQTYKAKPRELQVGDVLRASWGYEQTNIDYYQVVALVGKQSVKVREIGSIFSYDAQDRGSCAPDINNFIGDEITKKVDGDAIRINSSVRPRKITPKIINGAKIYDKDYWSSYH